MPRSSRLPEIDVDAVTALVQHVADTVVTPRFRALHADDVAEKSPGDLVTVVDLAAEAALVAGFAELTPGIPVVGEEGVAADPRLLQVISGAEQVWVVDPIDGTRAFVEGHPDHAVMVALVERGEAVGGWICLPQHERMYVATRGAGTWCGGERVRLEPAAARASGDRAAAAPGPDGAHAGTQASLLRGGVATHFLPDGVRERVTANLDRLGPAAYPSPRLWAGATYGRILSGREDFVFYWRTNPWDHAAGAVLIREAGGVSRRLDCSD
jgi:fructose-1,6-bisphosphatase/inositol monophosphatase family enzyme